jgi:hypothetical protein
VGGTLHRLDQVRDQVVAALRLGVDVGPRVVDQGRCQTAVVAHEERQPDHDDHGDDDPHDDHRSNVFAGRSRFEDCGPQGRPSGAGDREQQDRRGPLPSPVMSSRFATDTAATPLGSGRYAARVDLGWWIERGPNGGVAALILRVTAGGRSSGGSARSRSTLAPPVEGEVEIEVTVERQGRSMTSASARPCRTDVSWRRVAAFSTSSVDRVLHARHARRRPPRPSADARSTARQRADQPVMRRYSNGGPSGHGRSRRRRGGGRRARGRRGRWIASLRPSWATGRVSRTGGHRPCCGHGRCVDAPGVRPGRRADPGLTIDLTVHLDPRWRRHWVLVFRSTIASGVHRGGRRALEPTPTAGPVRQLAVILV